jgi:hypothetical protein
MSAGTRLEKHISAIKSERKLPGEGIPQVFQIMFVVVNSLIKRRKKEKKLWLLRVM